MALGTMDRVASGGDDIADEAAVNEFGEQGVVDLVDGALPCLQNAPQQAPLESGSGPSWRGRQLARSRWCCSSPA